MYEYILELSVYFKGTCLYRGMYLRKSERRPCNKYSNFSSSEKTMRIIKYSATMPSISRVFIEIGNLLHIKRRQMVCNIRKLMKMSTFIMSIHKKTALLLTLLWYFVVFHYGSKSNYAVKTALTFNNYKPVLGCPIDLIYWIKYKLCSLNLGFKLHRIG